MAGADDAGAEVRRILVVSAVSDPPLLPDAALRAIEESSRRLSVAFGDRTRGMEVLTSEEMRIVVGR